MSSDYNSSDFDEPVGIVANSKRKRERTPGKSSLYLQEVDLLNIRTSSHCAAEAQAYKHSCKICMTDYLSIARRCISGFGIFQCIEGHHLCKPCWEKLQGKKCPICRTDMCKPVIVRVLEDDVKEHPADCKWEGCRQRGVTLGTKREHEHACGQRVVSCVCGFKGIHELKIDHQKNCIKHHLKPLRQKVDSMQDTIVSLRHRIATLESRLQDTTAGNAEASSPPS